MTRQSKTTGKLFANGNHKLDKSVGVFSLPPIKTCVNCSTCAKTCFGVQAYKQYDNTRRAWDYNYKLSKTNNFIDTVNNQLKKGNKKIIRIHAVGDMYSDEYIDKWYNIIKDNSNISFYGYTKNLKALRLNELSNCNMIYSFIDGLRNYGSKEYCEQLNKQYGAYICSLKGSEKCMRECKACLTNDKVCFVIHGNKRYKDDYEQKVKAYFLKNKLDK